MKIKFWAVRVPKISTYQGTSKAVSQMSVNFLVFKITSKELIGIKALSITLIKSKLSGYHNLGQLEYSLFLLDSKI